MPWARGTPFPDENDRRYASGLTPTTAVNRSRKTVVDP